jgi:hypothetical protein
MAHSKYTGKSATSDIIAGGAGLPTGWRKITIAEKGKPIATPIDTTVSEDAAYVFTDDPLGGKGSASAVVTVEGYLSVTDVSETGLFATAIGYVDDVVVKKAASGDEYTLADAVLKSRATDPEFAGVVPYRATFEKTSDSGAWLTDVP